MNEAFIWDLDGTVLDSYKVIVPSLYDAAAQFGLKPDAEEIYRQVITGTVGDCLKMLAQAAGVPLAVIRPRYEAINAGRAQDVGLIPGAREALQALAAKGARHFVFTHRGSSALFILRHLGVLDLFGEVVTGEQGFPRKPAPDAVNYLLAKYDLDREHTYYVGDRNIDTECAGNAGIKGILYLPAGSPCTPNGAESLTVQDLRDICGLIFP